jgi:hypothetical protein
MLRAVQQQRAPGRAVREQAARRESHHRIKASNIPAALSWLTTAAAGQAVGLPSKHHFSAGIIP